MVSHTHTADWNHMLTERIMGNAELFDLFSFLVALGWRVGDVEGGVEGAHDCR